MIPAYLAQFIRSLLSHLGTEHLSLKTRNAAKPVCHCLRSNLRVLSMAVAHGRSCFDVGNDFIGDSTMGVGLRWTIWHLRQKLQITMMVFACMIDIPRQA